MLSRTLAVLQSLLFPWHEGHYRALAPPQPPPRKRRKTSPSIDTGTSEYPSTFRNLSPSLEDLNLDVFRLVGDQLHQQEISLHNLALSSRKLRTLCFPILFSRCRVDVRRTEGGDPPEAIRSYVRHFTHLGPLDKDGDPVYIENLLGKFPYLTSIALEELGGRITWAILKACVVLPNLASLSVHLGLYSLRASPFPQDDVSATSISLKRFSYGTTMWREKMTGVEYVRGGPSLKDMRPVYDFERECLSGIVLRLNNTATSLALPVESAPVLAMAELSWPHLRELALHGRLIDPVHAASLQHLLPSLPSLRKLSILAGRFSHRPVRHPILPGSSNPPSAPLQHTKWTPTLQPSNSPSSVRCSAASSTTNAPNPPALSEREPSPVPLLPELYSLAIAYPDPEDGIFSLSLPNLRHLSLRDQPRVYHRLTGNDAPAIVDGPYGGTWPAPLLSPEECLSILRRMDLSRLTSLELVYLASMPGADDELLTYIVDSLPQLEHLELHRYRGVKPRTRTAQVDHIHIARLLSAATSLRTLRLNLDFHDDHQAYCRSAWKRDLWFPVFKERGFEIVGVMQASCPLLEHVALLYHGHPTATWAEFHPQGCAEPRFVLDYTKDHMDSEPCPREWVSWIED
ncbi:hypothetical protein LXA43DRAFT_315817 [Ganoderma leucocontextum]|nr:hypothetical protein LXA43DRAFT_315817 [Ganoderma leucocontextum]